MSNFVLEQDKHPDPVLSKALSILAISHIKSGDACTYFPGGDGNPIHIFVVSDLDIAKVFEGFLERQTQKH